MLLSFIEIHWTCAHLDEARQICQNLINQRLIACSHIFPIESHFLWKDKIEIQNEWKITMKTRKEHFDKIKQFILENGAYEVPEILAFPILDGEERYLQWLNSCVLEDF